MLPNAHHPFRAARLFRGPDLTKAATRIHCDNLHNQSAGSLRSVMKLSDPDSRSKSQAIEAASGSKQSAAGLTLATVTAGSLTKNGVDLASTRLEFELFTLCFRSSTRSP
jgi:hypothetical protein